MAPEKRFRWAKLNYWDYLKSYIFVFGRPRLSFWLFWRCAIESTNIITRRLILGSTLIFFVCNVNAPAHESPLNTYIFVEAATQDATWWRMNDRRLRTHTLVRGTRTERNKSLFSDLAVVYSAHSIFKSFFSRFAARRRFSSLRMLDARSLGKRNECVIHCVPEPKEKLLYFIN